MNMILKRGGLVGVLIVFLVLTISASVNADKSSRKKRDDK